MALVPFPSAHPAPPDRSAPEGQESKDPLELSDPDDLVDQDELDGGGARMSFLEHLDELRNRLIHSVAAVCVGVGLTFFFHDPIYKFVFEPTRRVLPDGSKLVYTQPGEAFSLHIQIALIAGVVVAAPYIMLQVWRFIAPGLYSREKKLAIPFVLLSTIGFLGGALTNHYLMFPFMMRFFGSFNSADLLFLPSLDAVFSLYTKFLIAMGLIFQMPTIVMFLARMNMVTAGFLLRNIKYAILITFIVSAVITPTADPGTQTLFAMPMIALYILSIGIAWLVGRKRSAED
jgi:sec-independent protein translocase protein TatC